LALQEKLTSNALEMIENSKACGEFILQLINNILDSEKIDIGTLDINPKSCSTKDLILRVWRISKDLIRRKDLNGYLKVDKKLPPFLCIDTYRLSQVLLNLLGNSIKFTQKGHIWVTFEWLPEVRLSEECFLPLPYDEEGIFEKEQNMKLLSRSVNKEQDFCYVNSNQSCLEKLKINFDRQQYHGVLKMIVQYTGCGIKKDDLEVIFNKYAQFSCDPSLRSVGTGLGLYITKEICEKMGGKIRVYSKVGMGTTFVICIPT